MNIQQVRNEIMSLGKSPAAEKLYPITSDWVPVTDVLAIVNRFEKYWNNYKAHDTSAGKMIAEVLGKP